MKKDINSSKLIACMLALGFLTVGSGCTDSDYDLSNVDTTIGVGSDGLELPVCDTENIMLDDVLNLNNSDFVSIAENGDYMFNKDGDNADPSHPKINKVVVQKATINNNFKVTVALPAVAPVAARGKHRVSQIAEVSAEGKTVEFHYTGDASGDIKEIKEAKTSSDITIDVNVSPNLKRAVPVFKTLTLTVPSYMKLAIKQCSPKQPDYDAATGKVVFHNINSSAKIQLHAVLEAMNFREPATAENSLVHKPGKDGKDGRVDLNGVALMGVTFDEIDEAYASSSDLYVSSNMTMGAITVHEATGKFDPDIELSELGKVYITDIPDFLTDGEVKVNLYNPLINVKINSDIDIAGYISGTLYAEDEHGTLINSVAVPEFRINPNGVTKVAICKYAEGVDASLYHQVVAIPNLSDVIERIPRTVRFEANSRADATRESTMELGKRYTITPEYSISAPLAFDEGARIVYNDTLDGWNDDINDFELMDGAALMLTTDIENKVPAFLQLSAWAVDVNGNIIPHERINVEVSNTIKASEDGVTAVSTPVTIRLTEAQKGALKEVDGITYRVVAAANGDDKVIVDKTINAYNQTLRANNIKVKLVGRIIVNTDDDKE